MRGYLIVAALAALVLGWVGTIHATGGETCETATPITSLPFNDSDDTTGHVSDTSILSPATCSTYVTVDGPDLVYMLELGAGNDLTLSVTPITGSYDPSIYLYRGCGGGGMCAQGKDDAQAGMVEVLTVTDLPVGTYFLWVDAFYGSPNPGSGGAYTLSVTGDLGGSATTTPSTTTSTSTTTLDTADAICVGGGSIGKAVVKLGGAAGDETFTIGGMLSTAATLDPVARGAQLLLEDLGSATGTLLDLTAATTPIPPGAPGTGCDPKDGWKKLAYKNESGALDPPACPAGSARGLTSIRFKDKRGKGGGILFRAQGRHASFATPTGPFRFTVVLAADEATGLAGECASHTFPASGCKAKRATYRCK